MRTFLSRLLSRFIRRVPRRKRLFFVLKFGGKIYLRMTEDELRREIAATDGIGVQFRDKSLVFQCYEIEAVAILPPGEVASNVHPTVAKKKKPPGV